MTRICPRSRSEWREPGAKRGVSIYSYSDDIFKTVTLEDCLAPGDLAGDGQVIGLEILRELAHRRLPEPERRSG